MAQAERSSFFFLRFEPKTKRSQPFLKVVRYSISIHQFGRDQTTN